MNPPAETRPSEPDFDWIQPLVLGVVVVAGLAVCLPALIVAVPLAIAIENGGWRRWPTLVAGGAFTGVVVLAGGWDAYRHTIVSLWSHLRFHHPFHPSELLTLIPLGVASGILAAPLLPAMLHHRNEHEATRHYRRLSHERRSRTQAHPPLGGRLGRCPTSEPSSACRSAVTSGTGGSPAEAGPSLLRRSTPGGARHSSSARPAAGRRLPP